MKGRAIIPLVLGLAIGGVAIKVFVDVLKKAQGGQTDAVEVVRARIDIGPATEINETMVEVTRVPASLAPKLTFNNPKEVIGRVTTQTIPQGTAVVQTLLAPKGTPAGLTARIRDGYRAVSVKVDEYVGVAGWIKPGCRVDVVAVMSGRRGSDNETVSKVILQNVEVLAVGQDIGSSGETAASIAKSVTLLVTPDAVTKLHLAATKGVLRLAMRHQNDTESAQANSTTDNELLGGSATKPAAGNPAALLAGLMAKQPKPAPVATDKEPVAFKGPQPAPKPQWAVEVMDGSKTYQVVFDGEKRNARKVSDQNTGAARPKPAAAPAPTLPKRPPAPAGDDPAADYDVVDGKAVQVP